MIFIRFLSGKTLKLVSRLFAYFQIKIVPKLLKIERLAFTYFWRRRIKNVGPSCHFGGRCFISDRSSLVLGANVHIGRNGYIHSEGGVTIGDNTHISRNVTIYTVNHNYRGERLPFDSTSFRKPVSIGRNVWIGINVNIAPGVRIGEGAIIGMGAVVTKDVPPLAILKPGSEKATKFRDIVHYNNLDSKRMYGGINGRRLTKDELEFQNARDLGERMFFVVSTGRSGSTTIARVLNENESCSCQHEPRYQMIRISSDFLHGKITESDALNELSDNFIECSKYHDRITFGESDQKYGNLISLIHKVLPKAKFIWLLRDARDVVASTYGRGWFDDFEFGYAPTPMIPIHSEEPWSQFRPNGYEAGQFSESEWKYMSSFERNCWYWSFWNRTIEQQLKQVPDEQWMFLRLEELETRITDLQNFLKLNKVGVAVDSHNVAVHGRHKSDNWSSDEWEAYTKWCAQPMAEWYSQGERQ